jgi:hypothetical protein
VDQLSRPAATLQETDGLFGTTKMRDGQIPDYRVERAGRQPVRREPEHVVAHPAILPPDHGAVTAELLGGTTGGSGRAGV